MEKEEIQELIRTTITEMLSEMDQQEEHQEDQHQEEENHEDQHEEEQQPSELTQLRQELKELKAAIHHANFLRAGTKDPPKPELTPEQIFQDLINPKKGENNK